MSTSTVNVNGGSYSQSGGSLIAVSANFSNAGSFSFTGGTIAISGGALTPDQSGFTVSDPSGSLGYQGYQISGVALSAIGPALTLQSGAKSKISNNICIGNTGGAGEREHYRDGLVTEQQQRGDFCGDWRR